MMKAKERDAPEPVNPVVSGGVRYEAVHWGKTRGFGQNGGYIAAVDESSGQELWTLKVYDVSYEGDMEEDKLDVFITHLTLTDQGRVLIVENERNGRYSVDLATRTVTPL